MKIFRHFLKAVNDIDIILIMILLTTKLERFINFKTNTIFTSDILRKVKVKRSKKKSFFVKKNISSNLVKQESKVANATIVICCEKKVKNIDRRENGINLNTMYISRKKKSGQQKFSFGSLKVPVEEGSDCLPFRDTAGKKERRRSF